MFLSIWLYYVSASFRFKYTMKFNTRKFFLFFKLIGLVFFDIIKYSMRLIHLILKCKSPKLDEKSHGFVSVPIEMHNPYGLAFLACIISYIPGTILLNLSNENILTLHVLNPDDEQGLADLIKRKYEAPLMEIFE